MTPIEAFIKGWNVYAQNLVMPAGIVNPETKKLETWEEFVKDMSEGEAYATGAMKAEAYLKLVSGK